MALSSLYMDTPRVDISGTLANLRKEESDRKAKNWKSAQDLLRSAATDAIRSKYADQIEWDKGIEHADKVFKVQYERLMAVDPQAAAQLAEEYKVEREKRINKLVSDSYERKEEDPELKALEAEIAALGSSIQIQEQREQQIQRQAEQMAPESEAASEQMKGYRPASTVYQDEDETYQSAESHAAFPKATRAARKTEAQVGKAEDLMYGYTPASASMPDMGSSVLLQLYGQGPYGPGQVQPSSVGGKTSPLSTLYKGGL